MRLIIKVIILALLLGCSQQETDIFPLYKISVVASPELNHLEYNLSLNYASDTIVDTLVFYLNRNINIRSFYGRNLIIYHFDTLDYDSIPGHPSATTLRVLFDPPLQAYEYIRISADLDVRLDKITKADVSADGVKDFELNNNTSWYPVESGQPGFFYAVNVKTDTGYRITGNNRVHYIDGNWQMISEAPADEIKIRLEEK